MNRSLSLTLHRLAAATPVLGTLALLVAAAPFSYAASIKDDNVSVGVKANLQMRANLINSANDANGNTYDPNRATSGQSEFARFMVRRARFGLAIKSGDEWRGAITLRAGENAARTTTGAAENVTLYYAWVSRVFKIGGLDTELKLGLDKVYNGESSISSSTYMFPTDRQTAIINEFRGIGAAYKVTGSFFNVGADIQNNSTATKPVEASNGRPDDQNGYRYSARAEFSPGKDLWIAKKQESFWGKEGTGVILGCDWSRDDSALSGTYAATNTTTWGPDALIHWNYLSLLADVKWVNAVATSRTSAAAPNSVTRGRTWNIQAGWAIPVNTYAIEPALRYTKIDNNRANTSENTVYGNGENGNSGKQYDIGLNFYWRGHDVKTQVAFTSWKAEAGQGDAKIVRVQQQLNF